VLFIPCVLYTRPPFHSWHNSTQSSFCRSTVLPTVDDMVAVKQRMMPPALQCLVWRCKYSLYIACSDLHVPSYPAMSILHWIYYLSLCFRTFQISALPSERAAHSFTTVDEIVKSKLALLSKRKAAHGLLDWVIHCNNTSASLAPWKESLLNKRDIVGLL